MTLANFLTLSRICPGSLGVLLDPCRPGPVGPGLAVLGRLDRRHRWVDGATPRGGIASRHRSRPRGGQDRHRRHSAWRGSRQSPARLVGLGILGQRRPAVGGGRIISGAPSGPAHQANRYGKAATVLTFCGFFLIWIGWSGGWTLVLAGLCGGLWAAGTYVRAGLIGRNQEGHNS